MNVKSNIYIMTAKMDTVKSCTHHNCNELCLNFKIESTCKRISRFPFVCNRCLKLKECILNKFYYKADIAQKNIKIISQIISMIVN